MITVIHKKGKDPEEVGAYRPISILNVDGKLFAKILANRLNPLLERLLHPDQTGFVPKGNSTFNLRRLFNILYTKRENQPLILLYFQLMLKKHLIRLNGTTYLRSLKDSILGQSFCR